MQCQRCGSENTDGRSACWSCFAQLDAGPGAARLVSMEQPEPEPIAKPADLATAEEVSPPAGEEERMPWDLPLIGSSDTPESMQSPEPSAGESTHRTDSGCTCHAYHG